MDRFLLICDTNIYLNHFEDIRTLFRSILQHNLNLIISNSQNTFPNCNNSADSFKSFISNKYIDIIIPFEVMNQIIQLKDTTNPVLSSAKPGIVAPPPNTLSAFGSVEGNTERVCVENCEQFSNERTIESARTFYNWIHLILLKCNEFIKNYSNSVNTPFIRIQTDNEVFINNTYDVTQLKGHESILNCFLYYSQNIDKNLVAVCSDDPYFLDKNIKIFTSSDITNTLITGLSLN